MRLRASDMAAMFEVYMLVVALGALKTALDTTGPWYAETATFWAYGMTFVGGIVLVSVLALAIALLSRFPGPKNAGAPSSVTNPRALSKPPADAEEDMGELLSSLEHAAGFGKGTRGALAQVEEKVEIRTTTDTAELTVPRRTRSRRVLMTLLGPSVAAVIFCGVSAALLPGAAGFLQNSFTLNTFVILTFAYGWGGLTAYSVGSLFLAAAQT